MTQIVRPCNSNKSELNSKYYKSSQSWIIIPTQSYCALLINKSMYIIECYTYHHSQDHNFVLYHSLMQRHPVAQSNGNSRALSHYDFQVQRILFPSHHPIVAHLILHWPRSKIQLIKISINILYHKVDFESAHDYQSKVGARARRLITRVCTEKIKVTLLFLDIFIPRSASINWVFTRMLVTGRALNAFKSCLSDDLVSNFKTSYRYSSIISMFRMGVKVGSTQAQISQVYGTTTMYMYASRDKQL